MDSFNLPPPSIGRPSHDRWQRSFALLCSVLPGKTAAFRAAHEHSASAFEILDRWLDYECVNTLRLGVPGEYESADVPLLGEFGVDSLLTAPVGGQMNTGIPIVKAVLLLGVAEGRPETGLISEVSSGAYKARRSGGWRQIMPRALGAEPTISRALAHCRAHAESLLVAPGERTEAETAWLLALKRWCELLQADRRAPVRGPNLSPPSASRTLDDDEDDRWPVLPVIELVDRRNAPPLTSSDEIEMEPLPNSQAPEAPPDPQRAPPDIEDEPETGDGGESRRARSGFRGALENQFLPWTNRQLNPSDVAALVPAMKDALSRGRAVRDTVGVLAWAHVTGQLIEQAGDVQRTPLENRSYLDGRTYMRHVPPQEDAWEPTPEQLVLMRARAAHVPLALPDEVADWLDERLPEGGTGSLFQSLGIRAADAVAGAREWLSELRALTAGQQTLGRIQWWLPAALYQTGADHVPPRLLCAINEALPCPSAYYRSYEVHELGEMHRQTLIAAGWSFDSYQPDSADPGRRWVGSRLNPDPEHVKYLWDRVTRHFEAQVRDTSLPLYERHNAREIHETLSLMFQTFHRPVSDPLESLEYIDTEMRRLLIDDKSQGDARAHRLIPLTTLGARQCEEQIEHVRRLTAAIADEAPETAQRLLAMIEHPEWRVAPFRFLMSESLEIVRLTPKALLRELGGLWDLPLNLSRHFGSTWLLENQDSEARAASDESLCSLLGHHDLGTQNLSMLSPRDFDTLYATLIPRLEAFVEAMGLRSIQSFLPELAAGTSLIRSRKRPSEMAFGHRRREQVRALQRAGLQGEARQQIQEQLGTRGADELVQDDVDELFDKVRKATPNRRNYWASERFEAMRAAIVEICERFEDMKIELPAIALAIRDAAHICNMDSIGSAKWLDKMRVAATADWVDRYHRWRSDRTSASVASPELAVLSLVVDTLVIDPVVWRTWDGGDRQMDVFLDARDNAWIRMPLPARNTRLYPLRRDLAERLAGISRDGWKALKLEAVAELARSLMSPWYGVAGSPDFWQLLNRVQSGCAARMPGIALGYADGSHGSVSPERMCLERQDGLPPTAESVGAWEAERTTEVDTEHVLAASAVASPAGTGSLTEVATFRRRMSQAMRRLDRTRTQRPRKPKRHKLEPSGTAHAVATVTKTAASVAVDSADGAAPDGKRQTRALQGPLKRFLDSLDTQWSDLAESPGIPPACGLVVRWVHRMAKHGQAGGTDYAPKTLKNYWYSWALRFIEEFGPINPRFVSPSEFEEIYLQIVEDAVVRNRQHLYAPMRSFHRYLAAHHGVPAIDWSQLRSATGQGLTHVDANLVYEEEYSNALELLRTDEAVSGRVRTLQAAVLVLLYRFGLRIAECLGLRSDDVIFDAGKKEWMVRVRGNQYRGLKTDNARRTVVCLETLTVTENEVLQGWAAHVETFATGSDIRPLFAASVTGNQAIQLFPRRVVALRVGQALRLATGDPSIRVHHCRHAYATRLLLIGLGQATHASSDKKQRKVQRDLMQRMREVLTGEIDATRRLIWAIAVQLGHGSPLTTCETYAHGGHLILRQWCMDVLWRSPDDVCAAEWMAWCTGTTLKTMQRDFQRQQLKSEEERSARVLAQWSRMRRLGDGRRVRPATALPDLRLVEGANTLISTDLIIDHARRFGRIDGLAERLFVSELWVEVVVLAAGKFASRHRTPSTPADQWWIESEEVQYAQHEHPDIEVALQALEALNPAVLRTHCQKVEPFLVPSARMVVIECEQTLTSAATLAKTIVEDSHVVQLLVPAKLPKRLSPAERERRDNLARRKAALMKIPYQTRKPRLAHERAIEFDGSRELVDRARELGLSVIHHGRTAGARDGTHDWRRAGARLAVRIGENGHDNVRSAKVFTRILASAIVACNAQTLAKETSTRSRSV